MSPIKIKIQPVVDTMKTLLYQHDIELLHKLDFEDDSPFMEPMLFAHFNNNNKQNCLNEIMQGYFLKREELEIQSLLDQENVAYIPNLGYYDTEGNNVGDITCLTNTSIELLMRKPPLLHSIFRDTREHILNTKLITLNKALLEKYRNSLENAVDFIRNSCPGHFKLIEQCCKKIMLFKTDPKNTNSFATQKAQGIAFLNAYQEDYDEVFFVDDIAHQTGHIIMFAFWFKPQEHFCINPYTPLNTILQNSDEYRSFYVLCHALYTYYTSTLCLDNCVENKLFTQEQEREATARIGFYLKKYEYDLQCFMTFCQAMGDIDKVLKKDSKELFKSIFKQYKEIYSKYQPILKDFQYSNQPYNFTFSKFKKLNH